MEQHGVARRVTRTISATLVTVALIAAGIALPAAAGVGSAGAANATASGLTFSAPVLADHQAPFFLPPQLTAISCPSASFCVAVDSAGNVVTSTAPPGV